MKERLQRIPCRCPVQ